MSNKLGQPVAYRPAPRKPPRSTLQQASSQPIGRQPPVTPVLHLRHKKFLKKFLHCGKFAVISNCELTPAGRPGIAYTGSLAKGDEVAESDSPEEEAIEIGYR